MRTKKTLLTSMAFTGLLVAGTAYGQTAGVQVIHNSADAIADPVDIYLDGALALDDVAFRTATGFLPFPAGVEITVGIAPGNSTSADDIIAEFNYTLEDGETYILVANGIVSGSGYSPNQPFDLYATGGRTSAQGPGTDILVFHGSTDAPTVQVAELAVLGGAVIVPDLSYGNFAGYLEVPTANFVLEVQLPDGTPVVAYSAPLETLGLEGAAITVLASGFLNPSANSNGAPFGLFVALADGGELVELALYSPTARVQVIHNSADAIADPVDVYLDGALAIDDFAFRTATGFLDLTAGVEITVGIAPGNSTSADDIIAEFNYTLEEGETYILVANGIVSASGYTPIQPFDLYATGARETADGPGTDILVFHGSTDAPTVQVAETAVLGGAVIVPDLSYGDFAGYLEVPTADFVLEVQLPDGTPVVAYSAPLATLGLEGAAITVLASGFLDPSANSNGAAFGLFVALANGGPLVQLPLAGGGATALVQVIHNSADAAAAVVDVYLNDVLAVNDFAFRTATEFLALPAEEEIVIGIAPGNSTGAGDIIASFPFTLAADETYIVVANGIVSASGYTPNQPFDLYAVGGRTEAQGPGTDVLVFHGSTDAPTVQVAETAVLAGAVIVPPFSYGDFAGYLEVPTADFVLEVQLPDGTPVVAYDAPLAGLGLEGAAITVLASGFLDPSANSNGATFGLWVALAAGGELIPLPLSTGLNEQDGLFSGLRMWPNPADNQLFLAMDARESAQATMTITDMAGRIVRSLDLGVARGESQVVLELGDLSNGSYVLSIFGNESLRSLPLQILR